MIMGNFFYQWNKEKSWKEHYGNHRIFMARQDLSLVIYCPAHKDDITVAGRKINNGKSPGPSDIVSDMFKASLGTSSE